jgi:hypothetical protein
MTNVQRLENPKDGQQWIYFSAYISTSSTDQSTEVTFESYLPGSA